MFKSRWKFFGLLFLLIAIGLLMASTPLHASLKQDEGASSSTDGETKAKAKIVESCGKIFIPSEKNTGLTRQ